MATYIFDFDDTLFDVKKMVLRMFHILEKNGIKLAKIQETFYRSKDINNNYILTRHIDLLAKESRLNKKEFKRQWGELDLSKFLFKDALFVLHTVKKNHTIILLTKGNLNFQKEKIRKTKLNKIFEEKNIYIVKHKKENLIKKLKLQGEIYFINDKQEENLKIKELFPNFIIKNTIKKVI